MIFEKSKAFICYGVEIKNKVDPKTIISMGLADVLHSGIENNARQILACPETIQSVNAGEIQEVFALIDSFDTTRFDQLVSFTNIKEKPTWIIGAYYGN